MYQSTGTIKLIEDLQTFPSGFTKREFVLTTKEDRYPQDLKFETTREKIALVDSLNVGDEVTVSFDIRGNEFKGKYYVNLSAWRIEPAEGSSQKSGGASAEGSSYGNSNSSGSNDFAEPDPADFRKADEAGDDDIPF